MRKMNANEQRCIAAVSAVLLRLIDKYIADGGNAAGRR